MQINLTPREVERFWSRVVKTETCWHWTGAQLPKGHSQMRAGGRKYYVHCISWCLANGEIPGSLCVCHNCPGGDNPSCVNPSHLWLGTVGDNNRDKVAKGRSRNNPARGEASRNAKLSNILVRQLRTAFPQGGHGQWVELVRVASKLGVCRTTVYKAIVGRSWVDVD